MSGIAQRSAHADAIGIELVEHLHVETSGKRAAAEERRLEAHAFLVGERDNLEIERQRGVLPAQMRHAGDRQRHAEAAVEFAGVDDGVVMRPGDQRLRAGLAAAPAADDIAYGIDLGFQARREHEVADRRRCCLMSRAQVRAGQRRLVVAVRSEAFLHGHDVRADRLAQSFGKAKPGDAAYLRERFPPFGGSSVLHARGERGDDRSAIMAAHGQNEREAELVRVRLVEFAQARKLIGRARIEAGAALLAGRFGRQRGSDASTAGELRVRAGQRQLLVAACCSNGAGHRRMQIEHRSERALRGHTLGDPRRMLEYCAERIDELRRRHRIELGQSDHYSAFRANG